MDWDAGKGWKVLFEHSRGLPCFKASDESAGQPGGE